MKRKRKNFRSLWNTKVAKTMLAFNKIIKPERRLGILKGKATAVFVGGHNTREEEFFGTSILNA